MGGADIAKTSVSGVSSEQMKGHQHRHSDALPPWSESLLPLEERKGGGFGSRFRRA